VTGAATEQWFAGRSAIVTGAARGIGRATAELLSSLGAQVVAVDKDEDALAQTFTSPNPVSWVGDLADEAPEQLAAAIWEHHGPIQLLVNNVGVHTPQRFLELGKAEFDGAFGANLRGPWFFTKEIATRLVDAQLGGSIVFVSSLHDRVISTVPHYSASKAAGAMLVKELAYELAPNRIRVNAVSPGRIRTPRLSGNGKEQEEKLRRFVPLGRVGEPLDVARMVAILLSDEWSGYVTGTNVPVDGGLGLHSWSVEERAGQPPSPLRRLAGRLTRGGGDRTEPHETT
jgi:NAD(P)-dependent dehydrogenase (short-subunit alcohol dehydrogenase family)